MNTLDLIGWTGIVAIAAWWLWVNRKIPATKCGHRTYMSGSVVIFGKHVAFRLPVKDGQTQYCLECIGQMTVYCHRCLKRVLVGDELGWVRKSPAAAEEGAYNRYTCCLKCGSGQAGVWVIPGRVKILPVLQELVTPRV